MQSKSEAKGQLWVHALHLISQQSKPKARSKGQRKNNGNGEGNGKGNGSVARSAQEQPRQAKPNHAKSGQPSKVRRSKANAKPRANYGHTRCTFLPSKASQKQKAKAKAAAKARAKAQARSKAKPKSSQGKRSQTTPSQDSPAK